MSRPSRRSIARTVATLGPIALGLLLSACVTPGREAAAQSTPYMAYVTNKAGYEWADQGDRIWGRKDADCTNAKNFGFAAYVYSEWGYLYNNRHYFQLAMQYDEVAWRYAGSARSRHSNLGWITQVHRTAEDCFIWGYYRSYWASMGIQGY